jgi:hypothetical protein
MRVPAPRSQVSHLTIASDQFHPPGTPQRPPMPDHFLDLYELPESLKRRLRYDAEAALHKRWTFFGV